MPVEQKGHASGEEKLANVQGKRVEYKKAHSGSKENKGAQTKKPIKIPKRKKRNLKSRLTLQLRQNKIRLEMKKK